MATRTFKGNAPQTRLNGGINGSVTTFAVVSGTNYPTVGPFVVTIDKGTASEEKLLCSSRTGETFTVTTRGYDDTTGVTHADQATVEHTVDAAILTSLVGHLDNAIANPHPEYLTPAEGDAAYQAIANLVTHQVGHTFTVPSEVFVPVGDVDYVVPLFIPVAAGQTVTLVRAKHRINAGTSVTVKLQKNGVDITGWTGISVTTTSTVTDAADSALADGDMIQLIVTAVVGAPKNLSFTVYLEHS